MKLFITSIKDNLVGFGTFEMLQSTEIAKRSFITLCKTNNNVIHNPKDYALYELGTYDSETGIISPLESPKLILKADDYVGKEK